MLCPKCRGRAIRYCKNRWYLGKREQMWRCTECPHIFANHLGIPEKTEAKKP